MTDLAGTASDYFASMIEEYDSLIMRAVPTYEPMMSALLEYLPADVRRGLELGCGTGNFTLALLRRCPDARWVTVDASAEMVAATSARVAAEHPGAHVEGVVARFEDLGVVDGRFDLVTSYISLHHVVEKAEMFAGLRSLMVPGGSLCIADQFTGSAPRVADRHWQRWLEHCRSPGHCTEEEVDHLVEHSEAHDHYEPLSAYVRYLTEAGFVEVDCVWRDGMWAVVTAEVPAS